MNKNRKLPHSAVLWTAGASDGFGHRTFAAPVQVRCRWDMSQRQFRDAGSGEIRVSRATVLLGRQVSAGDRLRRATLASLDSSSEGPYIDGSFEVAAVSQASDVPGRRSFWRAFFA